MLVKITGKQSAIILCKKILLVYFILIIIEGALRKWLFPQFSSYLYFIKDPLLILLYAICYRYRIWPKSRLFFLTLGISYVLFVVVFLQAFLTDHLIKIGLFGWRNYVLTVPLAFIIGRIYTLDDVIKLAKFIVAISIPIAVLTFIQSHMPIESVFNRNVGGSEEFTVAQVVSGVVRPYGTFSYISGQTLFVGASFAMLLFIYFNSRARRKCSLMLYVLGCGACMSNLAVSGSRAAFGEVIVISVCALVSGIFIVRHRAGMRTLFVMTFLIAVSIVSFSTVFHQQYQNIIKRQSIALESEGTILNRVKSSIINIAELPGDMPVLGYGLGISTGGGAYLATGSRGFLYAETDLARNVVELGWLVGGMFVILRLLITGHIIFESARSVFRDRDISAMAIAGFVVPIVSVGQITIGGTAQSMGWYFVGISFALIKISSVKKDGEQA